MDEQGHSPLHCLPSQDDLGQEAFGGSAERGVAPPASISPACFSEVFLESG